MQFKRNAISYIVWIIAMVSFFIMAVGCAGDFYNLAFKGLSVFPASLDSKAILVICGGIFLLICLILFFICWGISSLFRKIPANPGVINSLETVFAIIVFALVIGYRFFDLLTVTELELDNRLFYEAAESWAHAKTGTSFVGCTSGISYIYTALLTLFMTFLGNGLLTAAILQCAIQVLILLLVFGAGRRLYGYSAAICTTLLLGFSSIFSEKLYDADPGCLLALVIVFEIYIISIFYKMENYTGKVVFAALAGLTSGFFIYLDALGLLITGYWLFAFIYELKESRERKDQLENLSDDELSPVWPYLCMLLCILAGFIMSFLIDGILSDSSFTQNLTAWFNNNYNADLPHIDCSKLGIRGYAECLIFTGLGFMTIPGFFKKKTCSNLLSWIIMAAMVFSPVTKLGYLGDDTVSMVIYALLSGCGFSLMICAADKRKNQMDMAFEFIDMMENKEIEKKESENKEIENKEIENKELDKTAETGESIATDIPVDALQNQNAEDQTEDPDDKELREVLEAIDVENHSESNINSEADVKTAKEELKPEVKVNISPEIKKETQLKPQTSPQPQIKAVPIEYETQVDDRPGMIHNPLPLPKKRKHAQADFKYEIPDEKMDFDLDIDDNDNFDI